MRKKPALASLAATTALLISTTFAFAFAATSSRVSSGSPSGNTPQNHQNEPAVALDAQAPNILVAGSNDFVDEQRCPQPLAVNRGTCLDRATPVGVSGVYFSFNSGHNWTQPTYTGWTNFDCDPTTVCKGHPGPIHTLPWYAENQLVLSATEAGVGLSSRDTATPRNPWNTGFGKENSTVVLKADVRFA